MRASLRTISLVIVSAIWGAALYAALFTEERYGEYDEAFVEALVEEVEQKALAKWRLEARIGEFTEDKPLLLSDLRRRHLNNIQPPPGPPMQNDLVWRGNNDAPSGPRVVGVDFSIREPFNFPMPHYSMSKNELLRSPWVMQLQTFLRGITGTQVSMVTASIEHQDVLLNWLISAYLVASPPLQDVLILTLDQSVYDLVAVRNISTLYVSEEMVIQPAANITRRFSQVLLL